MLVGLVVQSEITLQLFESIFMKVGSNLHGTQRMNHDAFGDPLSFHLMPILLIT